MAELDQSDDGTRARPIAESPDELGDTIPLFLGFGVIGLCLLGIVGAPLYQVAFWLREGFFPEVTFATLFGYPEQVLQALAGWAGVQKLLLWVYDLHLSGSLIIVWNIFAWPLLAWAGYAKRNQRATPAR